MSWDIFVQDFPPDAQTIEDVPTDFKPSSIGKRAIIVETIKELVPTADFSDPTWGVIDGDDWSIEVNIGAEEDCSGFAFHVRGGDTALGVIAEILQTLRLRAVDSQSGDFFKADSAAIDSFEKWRVYRDRVTNNLR